MPKPIKVVFVVPPEVILLDLTGPAHIFHTAQAHSANIELQYATMTDDQEVSSSAGLHFARLLPYQQLSLEPDDLLFIPGFSNTLLNDNQYMDSHLAFYRWLQEKYQNGVRMCSVCIGAYVLGEAGLLDGRSCTTHWGHFKKFQAKFPGCTLRKDAIFVESGGLFTSAGVTAGIDLSLYLIEDIFDTRLAIDVAKDAVVHLRRGPNEKQLSVYLQYRNHIDGRIHEAQNLVEKNLSQPMTADRLADEVNMSVRNLTRQFKKVVGISIGEYQDRVRLDHATRLLAEKNGVQFVANQCGLKSTNQLRSLLKKYQNVLPSELLQR